MSAPKYYYKDVYYGDWILTDVGPNAPKLWFDSESRLLEAVDGRPVVRLFPPPPQLGNTAYLTEDKAWGVRWRAMPARQIRWDREGIHGAVGLVFGVLFALALLTGDGFLLASAAVGQAIVLTLFLAYELSEGDRIRDFAYRDIGGYVVGWSAPVVPAFGYVLLL